MRIISNIPTYIIENKGDLSLNQTGGNTGNLLFFEALKNICTRNNAQLFSIDERETLIMIWWFNFANIITEFLNETLLILFKLNLKNAKIHKHWSTNNTWFHFRYPIAQNMLNK
jgi:hypothetical protein